MTFTEFLIVKCKIWPHCISKFSLDDYDDGGGLTVRLKIHFFSLLVPSGFRCHLLSGKRKISACFRLVTSAPSPGQQTALPAGCRHWLNPANWETDGFDGCWTFCHWRFFPLSNCCTLQFLGGQCFLFGWFQEIFPFMCFLSKDTQNLGEQACHRT